MSQPKNSTAETVLNRDEALEEHLALKDNGIMRRLVLAKLKQIEHGELQLLENGETLTFGTPNTRCPVQARLEVNDVSAYADVALGGAVAAAEAYMKNKWGSGDLTEVVRVFAANPHVLGRLNSGTARFLLPLLRLAHRLKRNSKAQSKRNIAAHYDLGNDFFSLFLDPTMSYSSTIYPQADSSLEAAAIHKLDVVCQKLQLNPADHLLEIGTGWGGLAIHAAGHYGCHVTTTTISERQHEYARQKIQAAGLQDKITLLKQDYRELNGSYDKLVSIEMIEAVGHEFLNSYIRACSERLHSHGRALIQAILITDHQFNDYRRSVDFIQKYIFPGGALPALNAILEAAHQHSDLQLNSLHDISLDYARTLRDWRMRFMHNLSEIRAQGYPEEFIRMWEYYFCYCEGGFIERTITTAQLVFDKPGCRLPIDVRPT